ncbi:MAG: hypothetical protein HY910_03680 [Desulfarculus sp.]|nr:hypothetical protein [Desulfarculus sp.]
MFNLSQAFHRARRDRNQAPVVLFCLTNAFGARLYCDRHPGPALAEQRASVMADGRQLADGGRKAGEGLWPLLERGARVLSFGRLRETLAPLKNEMLASLRQEEAGSLTLVLSNAGAKGQRPFSRLEAQENLLGATGELSVGYSGLEPQDFMSRFQGRVIAYRLEADRLTLTLRAL